MTASQLGRLLTVAETAERLALTRGALDTWRHRGRGEGPRWVKVGTRSVRYAEADVEAWLLAQRAASEVAS